MLLHGGYMAMEQTWPTLSLLIVVYPPLPLALTDEGRIDNNEEGTVSVRKEWRELGPPNVQYTPDTRVRMYSTRPRVTSEEYIKRGRSRTACVAPNVK